MYRMDGIFNNINIPLLSNPHPPYFFFVAF